MIKHRQTINSKPINFLNFDHATEYESEEAMLDALFEKYKETWHGHPPYNREDMRIIDSDQKHYAWTVTKKIVITRFSGIDFSDNPYGIGFCGY